MHKCSSDAARRAPSPPNRLRKFLSSAATPLVWESLELITNRLSNFGSLELIKLVLPGSPRALKAPLGSQARCAKLITAKERLARAETERLCRKEQTQHGGCWLELVSVGARRRSGHPRMGMGLSSRRTRGSGSNALPALGIEISLEVRCRSQGSGFP